MAIYNAMTAVTREAGSDLSTKQFYFVKVSSDGQFDLCGDGALAYGVLQDAPAAAGEAASIAIAGEVKVIAGGNIAAGDKVACNADGKAVAAASGDFILGVASVGGVSGDILTVKLDSAGKNV
jgi:hypothetical protein